MDETQGTLESTGDYLAEPCDMVSTSNETFEMCRKLSTSEEMENPKDALEGSDVFENSDSNFDSDPDTTLSKNQTAELDELRSELNRLREELLKKEKRIEKFDSEYNAFHTVYPDVPISSISDAVWQEVAQGNSLAAAYALAERRRLLLSRDAEAVNKTNKARSAGRMNAVTNEEFSPDEVRKMSQ